MTSGSPVGYPPSLLCLPSLPPGPAARWDLCFDQAVVFIEDAIQVGGVCSCCRGLGLSGAVETG